MSFYSRLMMSLAVFSFQPDKRFLCQSRATFSKACSVRLFSCCIFSALSARGSIPLSISFRASSRLRGGFLEGYGWIFAESQFNGLVIYPAFHFPQFGAGRRDLQIQATAVEKGIGLVFGLGVVDLFGDKRSDQFGHFGYF